jgi:hypothetical protein
MIQLGADYMLKNKQGKVPGEMAEEAADRVTMAAWIAEFTKQKFT